MVLASALSAAGVQFSLPPFAGDGGGGAARAAAALEAQGDLGAAVGLPPLGLGLPPIGVAPAGTAPADRE